SGTPFRQSWRTVRDGAALAPALVDGRIRADWNAGESENLRRGFAFFDWRIGFMPRAGGEEDPLLHRRDESAVRHHDQTAAALCLPRFRAFEGSARRIC